MSKLATMSGPISSFPAGTIGLVCMVGGVGSLGLSTAGEPYLQLGDVSHQLNLTRGRCVVWVRAGTLSPLSL